MLKRKIDKDTFSKLSDELKSFYEEKSGSYLLKVETSEEDPADELRRANERIKQEAKDAKEALKKAEEALAEASGVDAKKRGDIETLEKSWKEKITKIETEANAKIAAKDAFIRKTLVDSVATQLATKLGGDKAPLWLPHIKARLDADLTGEQPSTKILDSKGALSALTLDDLEKEFVANKDFSAILIASRASGGGAATDERKHDTGGANHANNGKPASLSTMPINDVVAYVGTKIQKS